MNQHTLPTLFIETATPRCSVGLLDADGEWSELEVEGKGSHSKALDAQVNQLLKERGVDAEAIKSIVLGRGPGSFTGLRIGASFVRGFCFGRDIPIRMMDTLIALAGRVCFENVENVNLDAIQEIHAILDARRTHVYHWSGTCVTTPEGVQRLETISSQAIRPIEDVEARLSEVSSAVLTGFGMERLTISNPEIQRFDPPEYLTRGQRWLFHTQNAHKYMQVTTAKDAVPLYLS
ncbi:MAG: tRNA (adenosine(37)-N6)-threonylcarbamoyltransferase complex dimerization subunit type 1 TsaB [Balneolaceae bacterium]|nr:tRNA (adenosine(37)-N6)-threonylcarbamoyltransferase complex dimerization subunit type 1 TsaB [Balneolaceae bacterium]MDR9446708.1 tRNA (adenosine(37)-N6)-threonylcarbamoyltransferase complex dimerization subunit type 1 TsaB [Balneolaceae bacterium]